MRRALAPLAPRRSRAVLRSQTVAALSQVAGAAQLALLLALSSVGRGTDAFLVLGAVTQVPITVYCLGVLYPSWLRRAPRGVAREVVSSAAASVVATLLGGGYLTLRGYPHGLLLEVAVPLAVFGAAYAACSVIAVQLACSGRPGALAGLPAVGSVTAVLGLLAADQLQLSLLPAMVLSESAGCVALFAVLTRRARRVLPATQEPAGPTERRAPLWQAAVLNVAASLLVQLALAALPAGTTTKVAVAVRVGQGVTLVGVNAVLPLFVNQTVFAERFLRRGVVVVALAAAWTAVLARTVSGPAGVPLPDGVVALLAGWTLLGVIDSIVVQAVMRTRSSTVLRRTALSNVPLYVAGSVATLTRHDSSAFATMLVVTALLSALVLLHALRWVPELPVVAAAGLAVLLGPISFPGAVASAALVTVVGGGTALLHGSAAHPSTGP